MTRAVAVAALLACGCIQDVQVAPDGAGSGVDAAARDAGAADADVADVGPPRDDAEPLDGALADGEVEDVGPADSGAAVAALRWAEMVLPPNTRSIDAMWGRAPDDVYAAAASGIVYHYSGSGDWQQVWRNNNNEGIKAMTGDATRLYMVGQSTAWAVDIGTMSVTTALRASSRQMHAVAPYQGGPAMLIGLEEMTAGVLARWTDTTITEINRPTGVRAVHSVFAALGDTYYFGGSAGAIHGYSAGAFAAELVMLPAEWDASQRGAMTFRGFAAVGGELYAVGGAHLVFARGGTASVPTWEIVYRSPASSREDLYAVAGGELVGGGVEAYAVGDAPASGSGIVRFDGADWRPQSAPDQWELRTIWRAHGDLYFAGGYRRNGIDGLVLRGSR